MPFTKAQVDKQKETLKELRSKEHAAFEAYEAAEYTYQDIIKARKEALMRLGEMLEIGYV